MSAAVSCIARRAMMTDRRARGHTAAVPSIPGVPETILVAPDSFKGTLTAAEVADALGEGLQKAGRPVDLCPVADGGEGTLEALRAALGGELDAVAVSDPLGRAIEASFALVAGAGDRTIAVVEMAAASGLALVAEDERDAFAASTYGTGELIAAALERGADVVYVGVGGSATTDGGAGAIQAIREAGGCGTRKIVVLCDVRTPFEDAARDVRAAEGRRQGRGPTADQRLNELAGRLERDPRGVPMTGAAGGLSGGLWAAFGAELVPGRVVRARRRRVRPPDAGRAGGRHRRGQARRAEPRRQARLGDRHPRAPVRRALLRGRRHAASSTRSARACSTSRSCSRRARRRSCGRRGSAAGGADLSSCDQLWANAPRLRSLGSGASSDSRNSVCSRRSSSSRSAISCVMPARTTIRSTLRSWRFSGNV